MRSAATAAELIKMHGSEMCVGRVCTDLLGQVPTDRAETDRSVTGKDRSTEAWGGMGKERCLV